MTPDWVGDGVGVRVGMAEGVWAVCGRRGAGRGPGWLAPERDKEDDRSTDDERSEADCGAHTLQLHTRQIRELYRLTAKLQQQLHHTAAHTQVGAAASLN